MHLSLCLLPLPCRSPSKVLAFHTASVMLSIVHSYMCKKEPVEAFIGDDTDITILNKSWVSPGIEDHKQICGNDIYTVHRFNCMMFWRVFILISTKPRFICQRIATNCHHEILCLKVSLLTSTLIFIYCFCAPGCDNLFSNELYHFRSVLLLPSCEVLIVR